MFDLIAAITTTRKTYEAGISVRAAITSGGEAEPLRALLLARFKEQATAFGYLVEPINDDAARGESEAEAAAE